MATCSSFPENRLSGDGIYVFLLVSFSETILCVGAVATRTLRRFYPVNPAKWPRPTSSVKLVLELQMRWEHHRMVSDASGILRIDDIPAIACFGLHMRDTPLRRVRPADDRGHIYKDYDEMVSGTLRVRSRRVLFRAPQLTFRPSASMGTRDQAHRREIRLSGGRRSYAAIA